MSAPILKIDIKINSNNTGNPFSGLLTISSKESIKINVITGSVILELNGDAVEEKEVISTFDIISEGHQIYQGEIYTIPFEFSLNKKHPTYQGKNVDYVYKLETSTLVDEDDIKKLELGVLKNIKSFITSDKTIKHTKYFRAKFLNEKYCCLEDDYLFTVTPGIGLKVVLAILIFIPCFIFTFYFFTNIQLILLIGAASFCFGLGSLIADKSLSKLIGDIFIKVKNTDNGFIFYVEHHNNTKLKNMTLSYHVTETVIETRSRNTEILDVRLFAARPKKTTYQKDVFFKLPKKRIPPSFQKNNASVKWVANLTGNYLLGQKINLETEFHVVLKN